MERIKQVVLLLSLLLIPSLGWSPISSRLNIAEEDGSPSTFPYKLKVTDGSLTDNGDGTATLSTSGGVGGGGGDSFGNHTATMSITANYGLSVSTVVVASSLTMTAGNLMLPNSTSTGGGSVYWNGTRGLSMHGNNMFLGQNAGKLTQTDGNTICLGNASCAALNSDLSSIYIGNASGGSATASDENICIGLNCMQAFAGGAQYGIVGMGSSVFQGYSAPFGFSTAVGFHALSSSLSGDFNNCFGAECGAAMTTGDSNSGFGYTALAANTVGSYNSAFGNYALNKNVGGGTNVVIGYAAGGEDNLGANAFPDNGPTTLNNSVLIGMGASTATATQQTNRMIAIGYGSKVGCQDCASIGTAGESMSVGIGTTTPAYNLAVLGASGTYVQYGTTVGSITVRDLTSGQCVQTGTGGRLTVTGSACGAGGGSGVSVYPATATASFPFGFSASTIAVNGAGDGEIVLTIFGSTYTVASSSIIPTVGHLAIYTSTWGTLGDGGTGAGGAGTPGDPVNSVQFNSAGSFAGSANFNWSGSSMSVLAPVRLSSHVVAAQGLISTTGGYGGASSATLAIYAASPAAFATKLFSVGTDQALNQVTIANETAMDMNYGITPGNLTIGTVTNPYKIKNSQNTNELTAWEAGNTNLYLRTSASDNGAIVLAPSFSTAVYINNAGGMTVTSSTTLKNQVGIIGTTTNAYSLKITTATQFSHVLVSTSGHIHTGGTVPIPSSCGTSPAVVGTDTAFTVTVGATTDVCTITFVVPYNVAPTCVMSDQTGSVLNTLNYTVSATAVTLSKTGLDGELVDVICIGH